MYKIQLPLEFTSAADGTNVVKIFEEAIDMALKFKQNPEKDIYETIFQAADSIKS